MPISPTPPSGRKTSSSGLVILGLCLVSYEKYVAGSDMLHRARPEVEHQPAIFVNPRKPPRQGAIRQIDRYLFTNSARHRTPFGDDG